MRQAPGESVQKLCPSCSTLAYTGDRRCPWCGTGYKRRVWGPLLALLLVQAALVLGGVRLWPAVALGALLTNTGTGVPAETVALITLGNTLEAVVGARLLARYGFRPTLERVRDVLALVALALAVLGIYGVIAFGVSQRTHEIGVRVALGARARDVLGLVMRQSLRWALVGVAVGTLVALGATRALGTLLYDVGASDPATFLTVALLLPLVLLLASLGPAWRASRLDPCLALREE